MAITINLPPETEKKLLEHVRQRGQDVSVFVHEVIERAMEAPPERGTNGGQAAPVPSSDDTAVHAGMTFDEILAPIRKGFAESGMTDEELDQLFEEALQEVRRERRKARLQ